MKFISIKKVKGRSIFATIKERKTNWIGHCIRKKNSIVNDCIEGMVKGGRKRGA